MVSWGMIGTGDVTEIKSGPAFYQAKGSTLHAVYNRTHGKAVDYAARHDVPVVHETLEALLADKQVDAVYVATPPVTHKELALKVIAAGKPLCLEKPMAMNGAECDEIIAAAEAAGVPVFVTYYRRSMEKFLKIRQLLGSGRIGTLSSVQVTQCQQIPGEVRDGGQIPWRFEPDISGGGILMDMGSHVLDILDFLVSPITEIQGFSANLGGCYKAEDVTGAAMMFENGIIGSALFNFNADRWCDRIVINGEQGTISFSCFTDEPVELSCNGAIEQYEFITPTPIYQPFVEEMLTRIAAGDRRGDAETACRPNYLIDGLLKTYIGK
ncbi:Gfo/Idh/MocA family protein [Desulfosediminicola sp.]|uniref:Gfo/Idh/MocA family protein n=1 Tax=Desulfosediminicola sp. TaxID=2886825 RepID=UPI003AF28021